MELSSFSENIVKVPYEKNGETIELSVNIDAFTPEFFREKGERFEHYVKQLPVAQKKTSRGKATKVKIFENEAIALETEREIYAELLASKVLTAWTVTENGEPVPPSKEVLLRLPPRLVVELWELCLNAAKTVKKKGAAEDEETTENMLNGSKGLRVVGQTT